MVKVKKTKIRDTEKFQENILENVLQLLPDMLVNIRPCPDDSKIPRLKVALNFTYDTAHDDEFGYDGPIVGRTFGFDINDPSN